MDSDTQLFKEIVAQFRNNAALHYTRLSLNIKNGTVTISGLVNTSAEHNAVACAVKRVSGIETLILEIRTAAVPMTITQVRANSQQDMDIVESR